MPIDWDLIESSKKHRLNTVYNIINKQGDNIKFCLNSVQESVLDGMHNRNLILKARQLGMSTFSVLYLLDECIWTPNMSAGIVSYSLEHAQHIFKRIIGHCLDNLPPWLNVRIINRSAREITFVNGSILRVDTTLRGGAYQLVLVSEYGKTCARNPMKAEEVITGTLQSVPHDGTVIIESTGEGSDGFFAEMVTKSALHKNKDLSPLDYKLFFFPWMSEPTYRMQHKVLFDPEMTDYFNKIEKEIGHEIYLDQRQWYIQQKILLGDKIKQEFPSTVSEAFLNSSEAYYFALGISTAYQSNRCLQISSYDPLAPVYIAMDIGVNDLTVIIFFQVVHGEIRVIDYLDDNGKGVDHYCRVLQQEKQFIYHTIFLPHDAARRDGIVVENTYEREFKKLFAHTQTRVMVLPKTDKQIQINNAKNKLSRCIFNLSRVKKLIDQLSKYRKKWSEQYGKYLDEPYHGAESNYADAFQYMCQAVGHIETVGGISGALEKHKKTVENRSRQII